MKQTMTVWGFKDGEQFRQDYDVSFIPQEIFEQMTNKILFENPSIDERKDSYVRIWMYGGANLASVPAVKETMENS